MPARSRLIFAVALLGLLGGLILVGLQTGQIGLDPGRRHSSCHVCGPIQHIVLIIKENHSLDNLFGRLKGVDGATYANVGDRRIRMGITPDRLRHDLGHGPQYALAAINGGGMNGFNQALFAYQMGMDVADSQYTRQEIPNYFAYASHFAIADHFFSTVLGGSFPNHLILTGGNAYHTIDNPTTPPNPRIRAWGCDSVPGTFVSTYNNGRKGEGFPAST